MPMVDANVWQLGSARVTKDDNGALSVAPSLCALFREWGRRDISPDDPDYDEFAGFAHWSGMIKAH